MLSMINRKYKLVDLPQAPLSSAEREWGAFRVLDASGVIFDEFGLNEAEATDLAIWLNGSIQRYSPDHHIWTNW